MSVKTSYLISINAFFLLLSYDLETLKPTGAEKTCRNYNWKFSCGFLGPIRFWSVNGMVINYLEVVLKVTDNGAAVEKDILNT